AGLIRTMEDRVPARDEQPRQGFQSGVVAQKGVQELARALGRERVEPELAVISLASPTMLVLGSIVDQQEQPGGGQTLDQGVKQRPRLVIDPVQVLEDHESGLALAF